MSDITKQADIEAKNLISGISKNLNRDDDTIAIIPKHLYDQAFKPYLEGTEKVTGDNPIIAKWVELAGGAHRPVKVVNGDGTNTIIPGILDTSKINREASANIDYSRIASEFELRKARLPKAGENYLDGQLKGVASMILPDKSEEVVNTKPKPTAAKVEPVPNDDYDLDY